MNYSFKKIVVGFHSFSFSQLQTEKMLCAAEEVVGEYVWGQYDILVLPPSFAYGGMENPCLTFLSPSLLVHTFTNTYYCTNF